MDLILTTDPDLVSDVQIAPNLGNSDHNMITFTVHYEHEVPTNIRSVRDYHRVDYEQIRLELIKTDWDHELSGNMEVCWNKFKNILLQLEDKYIPVKKSYSSGRMKKPIWMSRSAVNCVRRKNKIFKKYKDKNHPAVKKANKKATKALRKAKHIFEKKTCRQYKTRQEVFLCIH